MTFIGVTNIYLPSRSPFCVDLITMEKKANNHEMLTVTEYSYRSVYITIILWSVIVDFAAMVY